jgi:hypothetical protein
VTALDVVTGETVWRVRDKLPFTGDIVVSENSAFALAASTTGVSRLHHIELWTGKSRWIHDLDEQAASGQAPLVIGDTVAVVTKDRRGNGLTGLHIDSGSHAWDHEPGLSASGSAFFATSDSLFVNSSSGTLLCIEPDSGHVRYSHVFSRQLDADQPRRLDPVLMNGALFVPQHQVQVIKPKTGEIIGALPADLIADIMRVDGSSSVYVAEESGHLAAYQVAPKLRLVR